MTKEILYSFITGLDSKGKGLKPIVDDIDKDDTLMWGVDMIGCSFCGSEFVSIHPIPVSYPL